MSLPKTVAPLPLLLFLLALLPNPIHSGDLWTHEFSVEYNVQKCGETAKPGDFKRLHVHSVQLFSIDNDRMIQKTSITPIYNNDYNKFRTRGQEAGYSRHPDVCVTKPTDLVVYVAADSVANTYDITYGYTQRFLPMDGAKTDPDSNPNPYKDLPFVIKSVTYECFDFQNANKTVNGKSTFEVGGACDDPNTWIPSHGIYRLNSKGVSQLYYDPSIQTYLS